MNARTGFKFVFATKGVNPERFPIITSQSAHPGTDSCYNASIKYEPGKIVNPPEGWGPIAVFAKLEQAIFLIEQCVGFYQSNSMFPEVWKCSWWPWKEKLKRHFDMKPLFWCMKRVWSKTGYSVVKTVEPAIPLAGTRLARAVRLESLIYT